MADAAIRVPSTSTQHIQESHLAVEHIIYQLVERQPYGENSVAVVYHCHVYEIADLQDKSHIGGDVLRGWHRDTDVTQSAPHLGDCLSIFLYLTEVPDKAAGAFEIVPKRFIGGVERGLASYRV